MADILSTLPPDIKEDIEKATEILKNAGCTEIYLFGSLATGEFHKDSDIDIAVKGLPVHLFFKTGGKLMMALKHPFDLIELDRPGSSYARHIAGKGELIRVA